MAKLTEKQLKALEAGRNVFTSENQPEKVGRKKSKLKGLIETNDLSSTDVADLVITMFDKTSDELASIARDEGQPFLVRAFVKAMIRDLEGDSLYNINTLLDRAIGKATDNKKVLNTTLNEDGEEVGINTKNITEEQAKEMFHQLHNED